MKSSCTFEPHLVINEVTLFPGGEWLPSPSGWLFVGVNKGSAYWMHPRLNQELPAGAVLVVSKAANGTIRSSQLEETNLVFFHVQPDLITGVATLSEERFLRAAASQESLAMRILGPADPISESFRQLCERKSDRSLALRLRLLELFIQSLGPEAVATARDAEESPAGARERLEALLGQVPACEMMRMEFVELAKQLCCTPRHLSRTFREVVGVSFRQKQAEMRLVRARELLATTQSKVLDVALESGYQSPSLFNVMFKRHFGVTPAKWREQAGKRRSRNGVVERAPHRSAQACLV